MLSSNERTWEGDTPDIGAVLGLRTEYLNKKTSFRVFMEKMEEYILRKLDNGSDVLPLVREQKDPRVSFEKKHLPKELSTEDKKSEVKVEVHKQRIKMYVNREIELEANMVKVYGLVKGQCSHSLKAVLKREDDYDDKDGVQDVLWLLKTLQSLTSGLDNKSNKRCNLFDALLAFITMRQGENENDSAYMRRFKVNLDTLLSAGGRHILCSPELVEAADKKNITNEEREKEESKFKAIVFLKRSDPIRYGSFLTELQNSAHLNRDEYPVTETDALDLMVRRSGSFCTSIMSTSDGGRTSRLAHRRGGRGRGFNFVQNAGDSGGIRAPPGTVLMQGTDGRTHDILCYNCNRWGHYADKCPEREKTSLTGSTLMQYGYTMNQSGHDIPRELNFAGQLFHRQCF